MQAVLVLAPLVWLALPGSPLRHDAQPHATGIAYVAAASLLGLVWLFLRRAAVAASGLVFLIALLVVARASLAFGGSSDTFEAARALLAIAVGVSACVFGATLDERGRRVLARGASIVTLAVALFALFDVDGSFGGALGNSGPASAAALPGAIAGALLCASDRGAWRVVGAFAFAAFVAHAARAPSIANALACAVALVLAAWGARSGARRWLGSAALVALAAAVSPFVTAHATSGGTSEGASSRAAATAGGGDALEGSNVAASPASGAGARFLVWKSSLALFAAHPLLGVGAGQFRAAFPPFRDPAEIELSSRGRTSGGETEVEHPHSDLLLPWLEGGLVGGLAWFAFLACVVVRGWRALRDEEPAKRALAAAAFGVLCAAAAHAPLSANPIAAPLAFGCFGVVLAQPVEDGSRGWRFLVFFGVPFFALLTGRIDDLVDHAKALRPTLDPRASSDTFDRALTEARQAASDSPRMRALFARRAEARGEETDWVQAAWRDVLEVRPNSVEAWIQLGASCARADDEPGARAAWERARELDRDHPALARNLAVLALTHGRLDDGVALLDSFPSERAWLQGLFARLSLRGLDAESDAVLARADPELAVAGPQRSFDEAKALRARSAKDAEAARTARSRGETAVAALLESRALSTGEIADGLEARAHRAWARENALQGRFADAVRNLRQENRVLDERAIGARSRAKLELAAALAAAGRTDEARAKLAEVADAGPWKDRLPQWARDALAALGP